MMEKVVKLSDCGERIGIPDDNIYNAIIVPDEATNGDMVKTIFPNAEVKHIGWFEGIKCVAVKIGLRISYFTLDWWSSPFGKGVEE